MVNLSSFVFLKISFCFLLIFLFIQISKANFFSKVSSVLFHCLLDFIAAIEKSVVSVLYVYTHIYVHACTYIDMYVCIYSDYIFIFLYDAFYRYLCLFVCCNFIIMHLCVSLSRSCLSIISNSEDSCFSLLLENLMTFSSNIISILPLFYRSNFLRSNLLDFK